jgi:hypothetical protein
VNLKTLGGGMMKYKRLSIRRKNVTNIYITTRVMKTYRSTKKLEETQKKVVSEVRGQTYTELYQKYREIERVCTLKYLTDKRKCGLLITNRRRVNKAQRFKYYKLSPLLISHACSRANNKNSKQ